MITKAEFLNGLDKYHRKVLPAASGQMILNTVPASVDGGFWLDVSGDTPVPKFCYGGVSYPFSGIVEPSLPAELTSYLPFLSNLEDVRGNEWTTTGNPSIVDGALYLNGSSRLQFSNAAFLLSALAYTIDFWARPVISTGTLFHFLNSLVGSAQEYGSWIKLDLYQGSLRLVGYGNDASATYPHALNTRHHFASTYDGTIFKVYVDGQCLLTKERTTSAGGAFQIGGSDLDSLVDGFTGYIDHFRIFSGLVRWTSDFTPPTANDYR